MLGIEYTDFLMPGMLLLLAALVIVLILVFLWRFLFSKKTAKTAIETQSLFASDRNFAQRLKNLLNNSGDDLTTLVPELEEILLSADVGITVTEDLIKAMTSNSQLKNNTDRITALKSEMAKRLEPKTKFAIDTTHKPFVIYLVGVNGVGKTTTIGKLAKQFKDQGLQVMLVAADTFRAAAVEQLRVWSQRNAVAFSGGHDGMDPSAAIVDGLQAAVAQKVDVVLVDTAGRLHTKNNPTKSSWWSTPSRVKTAFHKPRFFGKPSLSQVSFSPNMTPHQRAVSFSLSQQKPAYPCVL